MKASGMNHVVLWLAIGCAGACGAVARYGVVEWTARHLRVRFPLATFFINITGAFALGLVFTVGVGHVATLASTRVILGTGFLGGYTTFSALSFESYALARRGHTLQAWLDAGGTVLAGVVAVSAGILLGHVL